MNWEIVEYQGHPAVTMGWETNWDKPQRERSLWYNPKEKWDGEYYNRFYSGRVIEGSHLSFVNKFTERWSSLDATGWTYAKETEPIKAPGRGGKDWHWEWRMGRWVKSYR